MNGIIAIWTGLLAEIPLGWKECNGTDTPDLRGFFIRGANGEAGATGGANTHNHTMPTAGAHDHSLTSNSMAHAHSLGSGGSHIHDSGTHLGDYLVTHPDDNRPATPVNSSGGSHSHTMSSGGASHGHTLTSSGGHTHTVNASNNEPPFYEVAYIQAGAGAKIEEGITILWAQESTPDGWKACDGDGAPNLLNKLLKGGTPGNTGGSPTHVHTINSAGAHSHSSSSSNAWHGHNVSQNDFNHNHGLVIIGNTGTMITLSLDSISVPHSHLFGGDYTTHNHRTSSSTGAHDNHVIAEGSNYPAYRNLTPLICSTGNRIPMNGIVMWNGLLAEIPASYVVCDGTNGTPDMRGRFVRGGLSGSGGSDTHTHTTGQITNHTHTISTGGSHNHGGWTNDEGGHMHSSHSTGRLYSGSKVTVLSSQTTGGEHDHSIGSSGGHTHTVNASGSHSHGDLSEASTLPPYYELIFIMHSFPVEAAGFKIGYKNNTYELSLVDVGFGAVNMGGIPRVKLDKIYDMYLVETGDPMASPVRIKTSTGIKAFRLKGG